MRIEDAFLQVVVDLDRLDDSRADWIRGAIDGGGDLICLKGGASHAEIRELVQVCRDEDALVVLVDDAEVAPEVGADGVHLSRSDAEIGLARTAVGVDGLVGMSAQSVDDAKLGILLGGDYLICGGDLGGHAIGALRAMATAPLYVTVENVDEARELIEVGVLRFSVPSDAIEGNDIAGALAEYSRLLGRCM